MPELANFPMISQRDGDANAAADCVPASLAACLEWLTGQKFSASEVKDAVYGAGYVGGTAAIQYVAYCASHGVKLAPVDGDGAQLVAALHSTIAAQHPALITEPSTLSGWTHVCAAYKSDAGSITVMDPWLDAPVTKSDDYWAGRLEFHQIWVLELENDMAIDINSPGVKNYFTETDPNHWQCKNGHTLQYGVLGYYKRNNGLLTLGLPLSSEVALDQAPATRQFFERGCLVYDPQRHYDNPPGSGDVYAAHVYDLDASTTALGQDPYIGKLLAMIQQLQAQPATDQSAAKKLADIKTIVNS